MNYWNKINPTVREYIWSSFVTFVTVFAGTAIPLVNVGQPISAPIILAITATAFRAAIRATMNLVSTWGATASSDPNKV